jgi:hypothetical protein
MERPVSWHDAFVVLESELRDATGSALGNAGVKGRSTHEGTY